MNQIKLQAFVNEKEFNKVMFKVVTQTARGAAFGTFGNKFRASNGIVLASNRNPANDTEDKNIIWLRGSNPAKDDTTVVVGITRWKKIVAAVNEYNAYFVAMAARRAAPAAPAANPCSVIIG